MKQGFLETLVQGQGSGSIPGGPMGPARHVQEVRRRGHHYSCRSSASLDRRLGLGRSF